MGTKHGGGKGGIAPKHKSSGGSNATSILINSVTKSHGTGKAAKKWGGQYPTSTVYGSKKKKKASTSSPHQLSSLTGGSSSSGGSRSHSGGGKKKKGKGKGKGKGGGGLPGVNMTEANGIVQADANSQIQALLNQARGQQASKDYQVRQANALFDRTKGDLDYLFNEAKDFNTGQQAKVNDRFAQTGTSIDNIFNTFTQSNNDAVASRKSAASDELARLGISQSGLGAFDSDAANASSMAGLNNANLKANLAAMQSGSNEISDMLSGMATGEHMSDVGRAENSKNDSVSQLNQTFAQYMQGVLGQVDTINSNKFKSSTDLALQLQQQRFTQAMQKRAAGMKTGLSKAARKKQARQQAALLKQYTASGNKLTNVLGSLH